MHGYTSVSSAGMKGGDIDLESGEKLYPGIGLAENQLLWGFIRKVYGILTAQMFMTTVVPAATMLYASDQRPTARKFRLTAFPHLHPLRKIVLEALILISAVVIALTGYSFWAAKKGKDFSFLGPLLFTSLFILVLTGFIQVFFPFGPTSVAMNSAIGAIIFSGYIVYDMENLIKRFNYDQYIWASAVTLYLDVLNLFLTILRMLKQDN